MRAPFPIPTGLHPSAQSVTCKDYLQARREGAQPRPVDADFEQAAKQLQKLPRPKKSKPPQP